MATLPTLRFAPSPNGDLHLGHARSAITGFTMARRLGGRFLVRIEDIDPARCREDLVTQILDDLAWLGLTWDGPVLRQSARFDLYRDAAAQLRQHGLLYPCFATRSEILAATQHGEASTDPDGVPLYPGLWRDAPASAVAERRAAGDPPAWRLDMVRAVEKTREKLQGRPLAFTELDADAGPQVIEAHPERWGDAVIVRKDTPASYHLAVVVDDAAQGVTHVTRGRDLFAATDLHRLLQVLLDLPAPDYHHHALILDPSGRKLSKTAGDTSLRQLRAQGATPQDIWHAVGFAR